VLPIVGALLFTYVILGGLDWLFLKLVRGQQAEVADAFAGFGPRFIPLMIFSLIVQLAAFVGFLLLILPGIYVMVVWMLFPSLLIMDKGLDFWPAMELSRKVVQHHFWKVLGLTLLCVLLTLAGTLACVIGLFVAFPVATAAVVYAYEELFTTHPVQITNGPVTT
jgi:uncharacterized membrane protein